MMEKSSSLLLTQEQLYLLKEYFSGNTTEMVKAALAVDRTGMSDDELRRVLDAGEYTIVDA